jgi:hypothetical protein
LNFLRPLTLDSIHNIVFLYSWTTKVRWWSLSESNRFKRVMIRLKSAVTKSLFLNRKVHTRSDSDPIIYAGSPQECNCFAYERDVGPSWSAQMKKVRTRHGQRSVCDSKRSAHEVEKVRSWSERSCKRRYWSGLVVPVTRKAPLWILMN